ncbi:MAG TPA: peptidoglycan-associated lipoprotein Pal [Terriglobales bacterium]|nr:peptidoglycan-associated lipoprotein Pal [Terriglobales bacterium]
MKHKMERATLIFVLGAMVTLSACHKANVASTVPPPPSPAAPTATLTATPSAVEKGQATTLTWETANASEVSMDTEGATTETLGSLKQKGSMQVTPSDSTTYILYAKGPGGKESASARVTVTVPAPPPPVPSGPSEDELFAQNVKDVYFDWDKADVRPDQQNVLEQDALFLRQHSQVSFTVEGHCDERGSIEYNLALGAKRANAVKELLVAAGVNSENVKTMSYGKEKPVCDEHDESCWQQNRRGHFSR